MASLPINPFDAAVYLCLVVAIIAGFRSGLLRSMATIFGYLAALPIALGTAAPVSQFTIMQFKLTQAPPWWAQPWFVLAAIFLVAGFALSALLRAAVSAAIGPDVSIPDRAAGAALGAVRVVLLAVVLVLIFDRIIPSGRDPAFLKESRLRPILSMAGREGLKSLPPDVVNTIDRLKKERGL